jgi:hypothetical protein
VAKAEAIDMLEATPLRPRGRHLASLPETNGDRSPTNGKEARWGATLPFYRSILALDIEGSTRRTNPVKEELRELVYRLVMGALGMAGIDIQDCDPFTDRGDGVLILLRATDDFPKPFLLSRLIPALASLLSAHNNSISPAEEMRILRLRAVVHAGEVHHDGKGFFGEDLDIAFRLLDAQRFKDHLKSGTAAPLALVASDSFYQSVIRHGYDGIDHLEYRPLVTVNVAKQRRKGWVHVPDGPPGTGEPPLPIAVPAQIRWARRLSGSAHNGTATGDDELNFAASPPSVVPMWPVTGALTCNGLSAVGRSARVALSGPDRCDRAIGLPAIGGWFRSGSETAAPGQAGGPGVLPGAGGWAVAVEDLGTVRVPGGGRSVRVQDQSPAPAVNHHLVMIKAKQDAVFDAGGAAVGLVADVVDLAGAGRLGAAAGPPAVPVPQGDGVPDRGRDGVAVPDVEGEAGPGEAGAELLAAQEGRESAGAGQ